MQNITVDKNRLLETLQQNRDKHTEEVAAAKDAYRGKAIQELQKRLDAARNGGKIDIYFSLPEPEDYTETFDRAIEMVKWEQSLSITLSEKDFQRYVLNQWEWKHAYAASTQSYLASPA